MAPGAPGGANAASSKPIPPVDASASEWAVAIERQRERRNSVALHALIDALPARRDASSRRAGSDAEKTGTEVDPTAERARLLALATSALAAIGVDPRTEPEMRANARRAFDDLFAAPSRDVRLAAMNAFALAYPDEREAVLHDLASDSDPLIRAKAQALLAALR